MKETEKASDTGIRRGQKECPLLVSAGCYIVTISLTKRQECLKTQNGTGPLIHKLHFVIILAPDDSSQAIKRLT